MEKHFPPYSLSKLIKDQRTIYIQISSAERIPIGLSNSHWKLEHLVHSYCGITFLPHYRSNDTYFTKLLAVKQAKTLWNIEHLVPPWPARSRLHAAFFDHSHHLSKKKIVWAQNWGISNIDTILVHASPLWPLVPLTRAALSCSELLRSLGLLYSQYRNNGIFKIISSISSISP